MNNFKKSHRIYSLGLMPFAKALLAEVVFAQY